MMILSGELKVKMMKMLKMMIWKKVETEM